MADKQNAPTLQNVIDNLIHRTMRDEMIWEKSRSYWTGTYGEMTARLWIDPAANGLHVLMHVGDEWKRLDSDAPSSKEVITKLLVALQQQEHRHRSNAEQSLMQQVLEKLTQEP